MKYSSLASLVFNDCLGVKSGDAVWINSWDHTLELARAFGSECVARGSSFLLTTQYENLWLRSILEGSKEQFGTVSPQVRAALSETDFYIFTMGPRNPIPWDSIPKIKRELISIWLDTRYDKTTYAREWAKIAKTKRVRMLSIEATLATPERAKALGLNYEEWRSVMFQGCDVNHKEIARRSQALAKLLSGKGGVHIATLSGTRLNLALDQRPVGISDGMATKVRAEKGMITFLPAGAIEVSVNEESASGTVVYTAPVRMDNETIRGLAIDLKDGCIHRHKATRGAAIFERYMKVGGRDASRLAYIGFGLNPNLRHGYTQDDKVLGGVTLGFGSNTGMGGKNKASRQWWASITKATVVIDDTKIMDEGKLLI